MMIKKRGKNFKYLVISVVVFVWLMFLVVNVFCIII